MVTFAILRHISGTAFCISYSLFDLCIIVDHARLPDCSWLTPLRRRFGLLRTAAMIEQVGGTLD